MVALWKLKILLLFFDKVIITHIFCEGIKAANQIANKVIYRDTKMIWRDYLSKESELLVIINNYMTNAMVLIVDCLNISRSYYCVIIKSTWLILRLNHFLKIKNTLSSVDVTISQKNCRVGYAIGGEQRKKELMTCKEWNMKSVVWEMLSKGKVIESIKKLHGYKPTIIKYFFRKWTKERVTMHEVTMNLIEEFVVEITGLPMGG